MRWGLSALLCLLGFGIVAAKTCDAKDGPVNCKVCGSDKYYVSNDLAGFPHVKSNLAPTPENLGSYEWMTCDDTGACQANIDGQAIMSAFSGSTSSGSDTSPANYLASLAIYIVFAILMCVLTTLYCICFCMGRYCCDCCFGAGGTCGKRFPTLKSGTLPLGFVEIKSGQFAYPPIGKWGSRGFMALFLFFLILWMGLGQVSGNMAQDQAMKAVVASPQNLVNLIKSLFTPFANLATNIISETLIPTIRNLNATILNATSIDVILSDVDCMLAQVDNLPNLTKIQAFVAQLETAFDGVKQVVAGVGPQLNFLQQQADGIRTAVGGLSSILTFISSTLNATSGNLSVLEGTIPPMLAFSAEAMNTSTQIGNELGTLANLPNTTFADDLNDKVQTFITQNTDSSANAALQAFYEAKRKVNESANFTQTANEMNAFNSRLQWAYDSHLALNASIAINQTKAALSGIYGLSNMVNASIQALLVQVRNLSFVGLRNIVLQLNQSVANAPSFNTLVNLILPVKNISNAIPCFLDAVAEVLKLNTSVIELPSSFNILSDITNQINSTLTPALNSVDNVLAQINDFSSQQNIFNVSDVLSTLDQMSQQITDQTNNLTVGSILNSSITAENQARSIDFSAQNDVDSFHNTLGTNRMSNQTIWEINAYEQTKPLYYSKVDAAIAALEYRLANGPASLTPADITTILIGDGVVNASAHITPNGSQDIARLASVISDAQAALNVSSVNTSIAEARQELNNVDVDGFSSQITNVQDQFNSFNITQKTSNIQDINNILQNLDFHSVNDTLNSMDSAFDSVNQRIAQARDARQFVRFIRDFIYIELPNSLNELMALTSHPANPANDGYCTLITQVAGILDNLIYSININTAAINNSAFNIDFNVTNSTAKVCKFLNVATGDEASQYGPIYYIIAFMQNLPLGSGSPISADQVVTPGTGEYRVNVDRNGDDYPNGAYCYTSECLNNEIDYVNNADLDQVSGGIIPLKLSKTNAIGLPYLFPLAVFIMGCIALVLSFIRSDGVVKCTTCTMTCCMFWQMPFIFIFAGIVWPLVLIVGDACYGAENVGYQILTEKYSNGGCGFLNSTGTLTDCTFTHDNITATVDFLQLYKSILGQQCSPDPVSMLITGVGSQLTDYPKNYVNTLISDGLGTIKFRPPMRNVLLGIGDSLSGVASSFVVDISTSLSCSAVSGVYYGFKNAFCCDTLSSLYWALGSWNLIAWTFVCCGCWASLLAYKRFPHELWGKQYLDYQHQGSDNDIESDQEDEKKGKKHHHNNQEVKQEVNPAVMPAYVGPVVITNPSRHSVDGERQSFSQKEGIEMKEVGHEGEHISKYIHEKVDGDDNNHKHHDGKDEKVPEEHARKKSEEGHMEGASPPAYVDIEGEQVPAKTLEEF